MQLQFHSFEFACFLAVVSLFVFGFRASGIQKFILIVASLFFYSWDHSHYIWLLLYSTCLDYWLGHKIASVEKSRKRFYLTISIVGNLSVLVYFKYLGFFNELLLDMGGKWEWRPQLILPIGISFYTFQTMSYSIDIYRGRLKPCKNIWNFALYVCFFPQLIAGPIVRASHFLPQLKEKIVFCPDNIRRGVELLVLGLFKKSMGDLLLNASSEISALSDDYSGAWVWFAIYSWTFHIYLDFSGYSDMAIGLARMFGLRLPENFRFPFLAASFSDLWKRWHITLSSWMRDYLYIPLGGNRCSKWRQGFNLIVTMSLSGLWHGASLNFLLWGFFHGLLLFFERTIVWKWIAQSRALATFLVFNAMSFLFLVFNLGESSLWFLKKFLLSLFSETRGNMTHSIGLGMYVMAAAVVVHFLAYRDEHFAEKIMANKLLRYVALFVAFLIGLIFVEHTPNVYFRF